MKPKILIVIGPTASGKSDLAVQIALQNNGEIISADSRQVYKGLDIGSGKITVDEMLDVKHYGLDIASPLDNFTAVNWLAYTQEKIQEIISKNKLPIIVGGTGLYIDSLLYGLDDKPGPDYTLRESLKSKTLIEIQDIIIKKCEENNSDYYINLNNSEKNNRERLIRKIETIDYEIQNAGKVRALNPDYDFEFIILNPEIKELENKIKIRLEKRMQDDALINEVQNIISNNSSSPDQKEKIINWLLRLGLEYKYITKYLIGELSLGDAKSLLLVDIIKYAKRQKTWNKKYKNLSPFALEYR